MKEDRIPYPVPAEAVSKEGIAQRSGSCEWELRYPKWLYQFLPQAYVTSRPFFTMEIRRQRALAREDDLIHLSIYRPWHILRIALGVWGLLISGMMISDTPLIFLDLIWHILGVLLILSLLDRFVLDFAGIIAPLDSISRDIIERRWSLVRLSDVSMRHLVRAKYAVAQIQVWPIMLSVIGIRLVVVVLSSLTLLVTPLIIPHNKVVNVYEPGLLTFMIVAVAWVIASVIFVIEPRWRLHTLVAAGLAVSSSRVGDRPGSMLLAGLGMISRIWIVQIFIVFASVCIATAAIGFTFRVEYSLYGFSTGVGYALQALLVGLITYRVYDGHTRTWLDLTYERLVRLGGAP